MIRPAPHIYETLNYYFFYALCWSRLYAHCTYVCMYVCVYVYMYVYMYVSIVCHLFTAYLDEI